MRALCVSQGSGGTSLQPSSQGWTLLPAGHGGQKGQALPGQEKLQATGCPSEPLQG